MSDFLKQMAASSARRAAAVDRRAVAQAPEKPLRTLRLDRFDVIAEIKERSPAEGALSGRNRIEQAALYERGGAAAISVLTEPSRFDGDLSHLAEIAASTEVPVMRKDFLVDPVQVVEARAAGASGVLLIVAMLEDRLLRDMLATAWEQSLFVLLESFDSDDLRRTRSLLEEREHADKADAGQLLAGVNTRNLRTLEVDAHRLASLAGELPAGTLAVAESGLRSADDARDARNAGYDLALVGTALMRSENPAALLQGMLAAGRAA